MFPAGKNPKKRPYVDLRWSFKHRASAELFKLVDQHVFLDGQGVFYNLPDCIEGRFMALSIKHPEADRLARQLAKTTGEGLTETVIKALRERLAREQGRKRRRPLSEELREIGERVAALPVLDPRTPEEIVGYDDRGLPR